VISVKVISLIPVFQPDAWQTWFKQAQPRSPTKQLLLSVGPELLDYTVTVTATDSSVGIQDVFDAVSSQTAVDHETFYLQLDTNRFEVINTCLCHNGRSFFLCLGGSSSIFSAKGAIDYNNIKFNDIKFSLPEPGHVE
jgi:hypothetical protein